MDKDGADSALPFSNDLKIIEDMEVFFYWYNAGGSIRIVRSKNGIRNVGNDNSGYSLLKYNKGYVVAEADCKAIVQSGQGAMQTEFTEYSAGQNIALISSFIMVFALPINH